MQLSVSTTLQKTNNRTGGTSVWKFGRLSNGWLAAKCVASGKKLFFRTPEQMDRCVQRFIKQYGYINPAAKPIKRSRQLSLALV